MQRSVELAINNVRDGGQPFGAALVKDGAIISEGVNELHLHYDISGHAELLAVRNAQQEFKTHDLSGAVMYASGYPCPMCLTAMSFSGIEEVYYCASIEELEGVGLTASANVYAELRKAAEERKVLFQHIPLGSELENPVQLWREMKETS